MIIFYQKIKDIIKKSNSQCYVYYDEKHYYPEMYENIQKLNYILKDYSRCRIAFYTGKSFNTYCGVFGILLSGNIWIPFNPDSPEKRNLEMIDLAKPSIILTDRDIPEKISSYARTNNIRIENIIEIFNANNKSELIYNDFKKDDLAYIMFTSGSTGIPKGVPMTNLNYINFIENAMKILPFEKGEIFSDFHDLGFDISIFYLFCCVLTESAFAPTLKDEERFFPIDNIIQNKITVWSSVPSAISRVATIRPEDQIKTNIKIMFLCGEPFRLDILKYCYHNLGLDNIYNFYGLTETGVENFYHICSINDINRFSKQGFVPIGKPLNGNKIKITDKKELLISGCQVTPGYLGNIGKERFEVIDNEIWYHTGDIVEFFEDVYFCKGRVDSQVKLAGFRVELMDVETHVRRYHDINDAVCFVNNSDMKNILLCAVETRVSIDENDLRKKLSKELPYYMIPTKFFYNETFPRNKNGKIDRKSIKEKYINHTLL